MVVETFGCWRGFWLGKDLGKHGLLVGLPVFEYVLALWLVLLVLFSGLTLLFLLMSLMFLVSNLVKPCSQPALALCKHTMLVLELVSFPS